MTWVLYGHLSVGLALAVGVTVTALLVGRQPSLRGILWAIGLGLVFLRAVLAVAVGGGVLLPSEASLTFVVGGLALAMTVPTAMLHGRTSGTL
jgi:hypothetical protein